MDGSRRLKNVLLIESSKLSTIVAHISWSDIKPNARKTMKIGISPLTLGIEILIAFSCKFSCNVLRLLRM